MTQHSPSNPYGQRDEAHQVYGDPRLQQPTAYPPGSPQYGAVYGSPPAGTPAAPATPPPVAATPFRPGPPRRGRSVLVLLGVAVLAVVCGGVALVATLIGSGAGSSPASSVTTAAGSSAAPAAAGKSPAGPVSAIPGKGIFLVGAAGGVKPGTYTATVPTDSPTGCYWARLSSLDTHGDIIDNGRGDAGDKLVVKVAASDKALEIRGECGPWRKTS